MIGVVPLEKRPRIEARGGRPRQHFGIDPSAGRVGRAVFAVGAAGENERSATAPHRPALAGRPAPTRGGQHELLIAAPFAAAIGRNQLDHRLAAADEAIRARLRRACVGPSRPDARRHSRPFLRARRPQSWRANSRAARPRFRPRRPPGRCCRSPGSSPGSVGADGAAARPFNAGNWPHGRQRPRRR